MEKGFDGFLFKLGFKKAPEQVIPLSPEELKKKMVLAREKYRSERRFANMEGSDNRGEIKETTKNDLRKAEEAVISMIPDEFERKFLQYYVENEFDLDEILDAHEKGKWEKPVKEVIGSMVRGLEWSLAREEKVPYSGKEIFLQTLALAKTEVDDSETDPTMRVIKRLEDYVEKKELFGKSLVDLGISEEEARHINGFIIFPFLLNRETRLPFKLFAQMTTNVPGGYQWVEKMVNSIDNGKKKNSVERTN